MEVLQHSIGCQPPLNPNEEDDSGSAAGEGRPLPLSSPGPRHTLLSMTLPPKGDQWLPAHAFFPLPSVACTGPDHGLGATHFMTTRNDCRTTTDKTHKPMADERPMGGGGGPLNDSLAARTISGTEHMVVVNVYSVNPRLFYIKKITYCVD